MSFGTAPSRCGHASFLGAGARSSKLALAACALLAISIGCSRTEGTPGRADLPALLAEAAPSDEAPLAKGSPAHRGVVEALRHLVATETKSGVEIGRLFWRPELSSYLLREHSYVGGTFPLGTGELLREVEALETQCLTAHEEFRGRLEEELAKAGVPAEERPALVTEMTDALAARRKPVLAAIEAHRTLVVAMAELYEWIGARSESVQSMRDGLKFSDEGLRESFESHVETVNAAIDAAGAAQQALDAEQKALVPWMRVPDRAKAR